MAENKIKEIYISIVLSVFSVGLLISPTEVMANTCLSTSAKTLKAFEPSSQLDDFKVEARHAFALQASKVIYDLSDLENVKSGPALIEAYNKFSLEIPRGFRPLKALSRRDTGLKYIVFRPDKPDLPWLLAFSGTENLIDWLSDLDQGRVQLEEADGLLDIFINCDWKDERGVPLANKSWIITGHSLGGGLAQAIAFKIQERRLKLQMPPIDLELVTFNAFGASDIVNVRSAAGIQTLMSMRAANYFLTGDPVSRVGGHIGRTFEIPMPPAKPSELVERHALASVEQRLEEIGGFRMVRQVRPPHSRTFNFLKRYGHFTHRWPGFLAQSLNGQLNDVNTLEGALNILTTRNLSGPFDRQALAYLSAVAYNFLRDLQKEPAGGPLHDDMVKRLTAITLVTMLHPSK